MILKFFGGESLITLPKVREDTFPIFSVYVIQFKHMIQVYFAGEFDRQEDITALTKVVCYTVWHADLHKVCSEYAHMLFCTATQKCWLFLLWLQLTCLMLPHKYSSLMHPYSIWSADANFNTRAPVEKILSLDPLDVCVIFHPNLLSCIC